MRIGIAQLNYHIGNFSYNFERISSEIKRAAGDGCDLLIFSELAVCGYPPLDLLEHKRFIDTSHETLERIAALTGDMGVLIGAPMLNEKKTGKSLFNSACFLQEGELKKTFNKTLLPTYDIFDEYRHFEPNREFGLLETGGKKIAVTVCEDLWYDQPMQSSFGNPRMYAVDPVTELMKLGPDLLVNIAASPFAHRRMEVKRQIFTETARSIGIPVIYVNQVGAQTELIFEGGSLVTDPSGRVVHELDFFNEDTLRFETDELLHPGKVGAEKKGPGRIDSIYRALVTGVRDYFHKMGFRTATLGLSGGIDSAVTLAVACEAIGKENLKVLLLPSQYSTDHSLSDARKLCDRLGCGHHTVGIHEIFDDFRSALQPLFEGMEEDTTEENIQSRIRGTLLMAFSNKFGHILLNTSNKSEAAVGYGTLYGDMTGGLSVLGDVYKTDVYRLAEYINREREVIPVHIIEKPPSAELKPGQLDSDSLPDYNRLDDILFAYIEQQKDADAIAADGFDRELVGKVLRMVNFNEYKRYQTPPILRISTKAFGAGRRMPLVAKY